jgi:tetratricopeptide (TPR) repeat protein
VKQQRNALCACGSGKKFKRCCGLEREIPSADLARLAAMIQAGRYLEAEVSSRELLARHPQSGLGWKILGLCLWMLGKDALPALENAAGHLPGDAEAHSNLGNAYRRLGKLQEAVTSHRRALAIKSDYAEAHNNLGSALRDLGQYAEAADNYRRAIAIKPDFAMGYGNLAKALHDLRQLDEAVAIYRRALALKPDLVEVHCGLGNALVDLGQPEEAVVSYRQALVLDPGCAEAHTNLGVALRQTGLPTDAEACCRRVLAADPNSIAAIILLAQLHADRGEFAAAEDRYKHAIAVQPESPEAWAGIAGLRRMTRDDAGWAAEMERIAAQRLPPRREAHLRYALGKYCDDVGEFDQAFAHYRRANELTRRRGGPRDRSDPAREADRIIQTFDERWIAAAGDGANPSSRPVLIVGMPRSGTTLAEQILASHPAVAGAGELPFWTVAAASHAPAADGASRDGSDIRGLADVYLRQLQGVSADSLRVVDKMPANFNNLGLIYAALPNAKIIHMRRNPIDTCLSIYFHDFQASHSYANDLGDLANYYGAYLRIMQHWRTRLPEGVLLEVSYEDLVRDQESWTRSMLEFIGLPWDPICLDFHRTARTITTFSKWQARQKLNGRSVERWRNYEKFIGPLRSLA